MRLQLYAPLFATFLVLMFLPHCFEAEGEQQGIQQTVNLVRLEIDEESIPIDISFNGTFSGQLTCRAILIFDLGIAIDHVDLYLEPEFPDHISVILEEYDVRLDSENPIYEFKANVSVDPGTSSAENPSVVLGGTARTNHGNEGGVETDSASIRILPYYSATIFFGVPTGSMNAGSSKDHTLTIQNTGNSGEHFILSVTNSEFLSSKGVEVIFEESRVYLEEGGETKIDVKVKVSSDTRRGSYLIKIAVWSERNGHATEQDNPASLTLNVQEGYTKLVGLIRDPIVLWIGLGVLIVIAALSIWGLIKLREHLLWKRTLRNIRNTSIHDEDQEGVQVPEDTYQ